jgi:hypothetical protein
LIDALRRAEFLATKIGVPSVEVDAIYNDAKRFEVRDGFLTLKDDPHHLFLPMTVIRKLQRPPCNRLAVIEFSRVQKNCHVPRMRLNPWAATP